MDKIAEVFAEIFDSEELILNFSKIDDIEEMYRFCLSVKGGYTREEFNIFLESLIRVCEGKLPVSYASNELGELNDNEVDLVSGGISQVKKWLAGGLAVASLVSANASTFATDAPNKKASVSISKKVDVDKESEKEDNSWWITKKLKSLGSTLWNHKGKIAIGTAVLAGLYYLSQRQGSSSADVAGLRERLRAEDQSRLNSMEEALNIIQNNRLSDVNWNDNNNQVTKFLNDLGFINANSSGDSEKIKNFLKEHDELKDQLNSGWFSSVKDKISANIPALASAGTLLTTLVSLGLGKADEGIKSLEGKMKFFGTFEKGINSLGRMLNDLTFSVSNYAEKLDRKPFDKDEKNQELIKELEEVRGQEKVKQKVKGFFQQVVNDRLRRAATGEKGKSKVIIFNGPSGTGKSFTANKLASTLTNAEPYIMSASEVDINRGSIVEQLFAKANYDNYWNPGERGFARYIKDHSTDGVVIINEYDKMYDKKSGENHPLDETLRAFIDEGKAIINGKEYDCSGITFILTTNESAGSLKGLVTSPKPGILIDPTVDNDNTGSRTIVKHDKSFLNRLTIAEFDNLTKKEYKEIAKDKFTPTLEFLKTKQGGNVTVNIEDDSYMKMGELLENINEGARPIDGFLGGLFVEIVSKVNELKDNGEPFENITLDVNFEYNDDKEFRFNIEDVNLNDENDEDENQIEQTEQTEPIEQTEQTETK